MNILLVLAFFYWRMPCNALLVSALQPREELSMYIYALRLESPSPGPLPTPLGHHGAPSFPSFPLLWGSFPPARWGTYASALSRLLSPSACSLPESTHPFSASGQSLRSLPCKQARLHCLSRFHSHVWTHDWLYVFTLLLPSVGRTTC